MQQSWVKYYDQFGFCWEDHSLPLAEARAKYERLTADRSVTFAQFGAKTSEGNITLGEYRKPVVWTAEDIMRQEG